MANTNRNPVDAYSKSEFEGGLDALEKSGINYEPPSKEREQKEDWQLIHAVVGDDEKSALAKLDQLYANARRVAKKEHAERTKKDLETIRGMLAALCMEAEERARQIGTREAQRRARQIAEVVNETIQTTKQRPGDVESMKSSIDAVREGLSWLDRESPLAKDRYGKDNYAEAV